MIANEPEKENSYAFPSSHYYVPCDENDKNVLLKTLQMEPFVLPPFSFFDGNGYVHHDGAEYPCHHNLHFYVYFVSDDIKLPAAIEFGYGCGLPISS